MALDHDGLFKVIGKFVKSINTVYAYVSSLNTLEGEIFVVLEEEDLERYYANPISLPDQFDGFQTQITNWIIQLIGNTQSILTDRDYVVDQLNLFQFSVANILNALYDYMVVTGETVQSSVVSIGGSDVDRNVSTNVDANGDAVDATNNSYPRLFVFRKLDGVNSPGNNVLPNSRYADIESQLAKSATVYAELITNGLQSESAQLYSGVSAIESYQILTEDPGLGPTLSTPEASNPLSNYDFTEWDGDNPLTWSASGTISTDYSDNSGVGNGPIRFDTPGTVVLQKLEGLSHNIRYFLGAYCATPSSNTSNDTFKLRIRNLAGSALSSVFSLVLGDNEFGILYGDVLFPENIDLSDVYIEVEYDAQSDAANYGLVQKVVFSQVTYWNGLGWVWWPPYHPSSTAGYVPLGHTTSIAVSNSNAGVFQTFFRKGLAVQIHTADSPTIADSLAT